MSGFLNGSMRTLRSFLPAGTKGESIGFARFDNEGTGQCKEVTELSSLSNGAVSKAGYQEGGDGGGGGGGGGGYEGSDGGYMKFPEEDDDEDARARRGNRISPWQAGWNVTNAIQGMFIVTFPYTVVEGGYWAIFSMILVAYICCYTGKVLVECLYEENAAGVKERVRHSYGDVAEEVWGKQIGGRIVNAAQLIELLMTCILYVLLCGDLMIGSFPDTPMDLSSWIMLCSAFLLPCAFLKSLRHVSWLSFWCTVAHMFINAIILIYCLTQAAHWQWGMVQIKIDIWTFPISLGIVIFSYTSQIFLPTLEGNLTDRSKFGCMMHWTHVSAAIFKALFSWVGFLTWGMATKEVVTNNLPNHGMKIIVNLFLVAKALLSYPLPYFAATDLIEKSLFVGKPTTLFPSCHDAAGVLKIWGLALRLGLVVLTLLMAIFIPHFNILMGLIGSVTGNMLSLVWPSYFHLRIKGPQLKWYQKAFDIFIILLGMVCAGLGIYYSSHALARAFQGFEPRPFQGKYNIPVQSPNQYKT